MQKSFEIRHPSVDEYASLQALWLRCFDDAPNVVERFFENTVTPENVIAAYSGDNPVSVLYMIDCLIRNRGVEYKSYYVYAVCTDPHFRGMGLMKKCFDFLFEAAEKRGIDYLFLVPAQDNLFEMYKKLGFKNGFSCSERVISSQMHCGKAPVTEKLGFEDYKNLRNSFSEKITLASLCEKGFKGFLSPESETVKAVKCKDSYGVYEAEGDSVTVHELFGDEKTVLQCIFSLTKAASLTVRGVAFDGNSKQVGMWLALKNAPQLENAFFGIPYGG